MPGSCPACPQQQICIPFSTRTSRFRFQCPIWERYDTFQRSLGPGPGVAFQNTLRRPKPALPLSKPNGILNGIGHGSVERVVEVVEGVEVVVVAPAPERQDRFEFF